MTKYYDLDDLLGDLLFILGMIVGLCIITDIILFWERKTTED
jgi:hypothetical protein